MDWSSIPWDAIAAIGTCITSVIMIIIFYKTIYMQHSKRIALTYISTLSYNKASLIVYNEGNRSINIDDIRILFYGKIINSRDTDKFFNCNYSGKNIPVDNSIEIKLINWYNLYDLLENEWKERISSSRILKFLYRSEYNKKDNKKDKTNKKDKYYFFKFKLIIQSDYNVFISKKWIYIHNFRDLCELYNSKECSGCIVLEVEQDKLNYKMKRDLGYASKYYDYQKLLQTINISILELLIIVSVIIYIKNYDNFYVISYMFFIIVVILIFNLYSSNKYGKINKKEYLIYCSMIILSVLILTILNKVDIRDTLSCIISIISIFLMIYLYKLREKLKNISSKY